MMIRPRNIALLLCCLAVCVSADSFLDDVEKLTSEEATKEAKKVIDEQTVGFDLRDDKFYFQDNLVNELYKRNKYTHGLITLAGQGSDAMNTRARDSSYPFAVAQRATKPMGTVADRWDAKDLGDVELFALYHGEGSHFVVNKLRAHLLRRLANMIQEYAKVLDRSMGEDAKGHEKEVGVIHDEIRQAIENVFIDVDQSIRLAMYDNDDSSASATVVIVTPASVITASVGQGLVLAYADAEAHMIQRLTSYFEDSSFKNVFGARKSRQTVVLKPHVEIYSRQEHQLQLLVLESATVAQNVNDYELFKTVLSEVNQHKRNSANEQQIYSSSVSRILESSVSKGNPVAKFFSPATDHSIILVGLERNYENIH